MTKYWRTQGFLVAGRPGGCCVRCARPRATLWADAPLRLGFPTGWSELGGGRRGRGDP